jgi:CheY-like chemotaxis protein
VADQGPGIPEADRELIFERFRQAHRPTRQHLGGSGLGLSIAKSLVQRMGGELVVESHPGAGAIFRFHVPVAQAAKPPEVLLKPVASARLAELRVLLADDNATNRFIVSRFCEQSGITIVTVQNGMEALDALRRECFDVVLMDIHMPVLSGAEAIRQIRTSDEKFCNVPIIVLSADAMDVAMQEMRALGANEYLSKPIDADALLTQIARLAGQVEVLCNEQPTGQEA